MLERVGQRLLHDAVGGELERGRERALVAGHEQLDLEAALSGLADQLRQLCKVGLRREIVGLLRTAEKAEQAVELEDGLAARVLDRAQHLHRLLRPALQHAAGGAGLDTHHADVVRDDVVQLPRDSHALLEHSPPRVLVALSLELCGLRGELFLALSERAHGQAEQQREGDQDGEVVGEQHPLRQRQILQDELVEEELAHDLRDECQSDPGEGERRPATGTPVHRGAVESHPAGPDDEVLLLVRRRKPDSPQRERGDDGGRRRQREATAKRQGEHDRCEDEDRTAAPMLEARILAL